MKIINRTTGKLVITFKTKGGGVGCGFIPPNGPPLTRDFGQPAEVIIQTDDPSIVYHDVTDQTITVQSSID